MHKIMILIKHLLLWFLLCVILLWFQSPKLKLDKNANSWIDQVDEIGTYYMRQEKIPGYQLTYFNQGEIIETISKGVSSRTHKKRVDDHTVFHAQSMTKTMTAVMILKLVEANQLSLDQSLETILPEDFLKEIPSIYHDVTVRALLTHQSGMPTGDYNKMYALYDNHIPSLSSSILMDLADEERNNGFHYSNVGYHILEMIIEEKSQMTYSAYAKDVCFFLPSNAINFEQEDLIHMDVSFGYDLKHQEVAPYRYPELASGGLYTTSSHYATFLIELLKHQMISSDFVDLMLNIEIQDIGYYNNVYHGYGLGLFINQHQNEKIISHGGQGRGYMAYYHVDPYEMSGFVILTNSQRSYPFFAELTDAFNTYHDLELSGLYKIQWVTIVLTYLSALFIYIAARLVYLMTKIKTSKLSKFVTLNGILSICLMIAVIILQNQSYNLLYAIAPHAYEQLLMIMFITALFGTVFALAKQLIIMSKGGERSACNT